MINDVQAACVMPKVSQPPKVDLNKNFQTWFKPLPSDDLQKSDSFQSLNKNEQTMEAPEIKTSRILIGRLKKEDIDAINESGKLPKNAKFKEMNGKITIAWNAFDITTGTHTLPAGYEVKNDIFGFTHVVREGTKNLFIK